MDRRRTAGFVASGLVAALLATAIRG